MSDLLWTTHDGRQIPVEELHPAHMQNIIRMFIRKRLIWEQIIAEFMLTKPELIKQFLDAAKEIQVLTEIDIMENEMLGSLQESLDA